MAHHRAHVASALGILLRYRSRRTRAPIQALAMKGAQERAIAVFAKVPQPGLAKTRLAPMLGADGAASLQARLIEHALCKARAVDNADVCLWLAGDTSRYTVPSGMSWA